MRTNSWKHDPNSARRIVTRTPLDELWTDEGPLAATRRRTLASEDLWDLVQQGAARFVVASVGKALCWLSGHAGYDFCKSELRAHLAAPGEADAVPDDFPGGYCYHASEWQLQDGGTVVLLEVAR